MLHSSMFLFTALVATFANVVFADSLYDQLEGQHVLRCIMDKEQLAHLEMQAANDGNIDIWGRQLSDTNELIVDVMIPRGYFTMKSYRCFNWIDDPLSLFTVQNEVASDSDFFDKYRTYDEMMAKLSELQQKYPTLMTSDVIGKSHQHRTIPVVKVTGSKVNQAIGKQTIWINGGQHAREWIGPAVNFWVLTQLLEGYGTNNQITKLMDKYIFAVAPMINPDGYEFSRTSYRMWRKNRRDNGRNIYGVDLNRNWDDHWGLVGSSRSPSSDIYMGPSAASEPEIKGTQDYIAKKLENPIAGIDFHAYGQMILRNWGWTADLAGHEGEIRPLGEAMMNAIKAATNMSYKNIRIAELYPTAGSSGDWMYNKVKGMYGFGVELRDTGRYGFALPASQIRPTGKDAMAAVVALAEKLLEMNSKTTNEFKLNFH